MRALHARLLPLLLQQQTRLHAAAGRGSSGEHAQHLRWLLRTPACQGVSPLTADGTSRAFVKRAAAAAAKKHKQRKQTQQHSVEPKQSTEPKSARESAAAMRRAMLQQLQHMGVRHATAVALQKAWTDGSLRDFPAAGSLLLRKGVQGRETSLSGPRLLVHLRRLLGAHAHAAASGAALGAPHWGQLDMQAVLANNPALLLAAPELLAARMSQLLAGLATLVEAARARAFIQASPTLRLQLQDVDGTVRRVQAMRDAYVEVLGSPPKPALLAASQSSFSRATQQVFRSKLEFFVQGFGQAAAHRVLIRQPHLLSSSVDKLASNVTQLQELLGCSDDVLQRLVQKAPRLLSSDVQHTRAGLVTLVSQLQRLGLSSADVRQMVLKEPQLMTQSPLSRAAKLEELQRALSPAGSGKLHALLNAQPNLLGHSMAALTGKMRSLQQLLGLSDDGLHRVVARAPSLLTLTPANLQSKLRRLAQVMGADDGAMRAVCRRQPALLSLSPDSMARKLQMWAQVLRLPQADVATAVMASPVLLLYDAETVASQMQLLARLVSRSQLWSTGGAPARTHARVRASWQKPLSPTWQLQYSLSTSGRLPLRLEYLLATGQQEQVKLSDAKRLPNSDWDARFPSFQAWARPWVQQLQAHPDHWPPLLAQRAAACLSSERAQFAAAAAAKGRAAAAAHKEAAAAKRTP